MELSEWARRWRAHCFVDVKGGGGPLVTLRPKISKKLTFVDLNS